jgi:hypothetical protein
VERAARGRKSRSREERGGNFWMLQEVKSICDSGSAEDAGGSIQDRRCAVRSQGKTKIRRRSLMPGSGRHQQDFGSQPLPSLSCSASKISYIRGVVGDNDCGGLVGHGSSGDLLLLLPRYSGN